jgi:hypothetical protein
VTLDTGNKQPVGIGLRILNEVCGSLFGGDSDQGHSLIRWLEPDDFGTFDRSTSRFVSTIALSLSTLSLLLFLGSCGGWAKEAKRSGEKLSRHALNNSNNVPGELRFDFVSDPGSER